MRTIDERLAGLRLVPLLVAASLFLFLSSLRLESATVIAASPNRAHVLAAYNLTANGDTLQIPAGTSTPWTDQIIVAKNITIKGAGKSATTLINGIVTTDWHGRKPIFYVTASGTWRITSLGFNGQYTSGSTGGKGVVVVGGNGRINDCLFSRCNDRGVQAFVPSGLIDHCIFIDCWSSAGFYADQYGAWLRPLNIGTTNCWVFEDNYDFKSGAVYAPVGSDGGWGARYVWRFNIFSNQAPTGCDYALDAHGNQGKPFGDPALSIAGTVFLESYNNLFSMGNANRGNILRGGTQLHYNNRYFATGGNILTFNTVFMLSEEDGYRFGNPIKTTWPAYQQITNSYFWANSWNGATNPAPQLEFPGTTPCLNPDGCGAPWPSDGIFIQEGRDYWRTKPTTNFYVPLAYPHPRVVADNDPAIPAAFALFAPSNGQTGFGLTDSLSWIDTTGETSYRLIISRDRFFSDVVLDSSISANSTAYGPIQPGVLTNNTTYFWLMRAIGPNGLITSTDAPWTFTTGAGQTFPPSTPINSSPANGAGAQSLTLTLQGSAYSDPQASAHDASQFIIYANDQTTIVKDSGTLAAVTSYAVPADTLTFLTVYYWKVRYRNALGLWSAYSTLTSFSTLSPSGPTTPTNVSPANGATDVDRSPTLTGSAYSDPQSSAQTASQWLLINGTNVIDSGEWIATVTYDVPIVLSNATLYAWQVRYKNSYDIWSDYSAQTTFTTTNSVAPPPEPPPPPPPPPPDPPNTPVNVSPANNAVNVSITPLLSASAYSDPQLFPQAASQWLLLHLGTNLVDSGSYAPTNNYPITNELESVTVYTWQVRYQNNIGLWSSYSTPTAFTTTNAVVPPPPPPPSTNPPVLPPPNPPVPTNSPLRNNIVIFRGTVELRGIWSSE